MDGLMLKGYRPFAPWNQRGSSDRPIGLIAGWGRFPIQVVEELVRRKTPVVCVAIHGHADTHLEYLCARVKWAGVGRMGAHLRFFRKHGVRQVTMAGKLFKSDLLYGGSVWLRHAPDFECLRTFGPLLLSRRADARDDSLLTAVTKMYARHDMQVVPATDLAPQLLAGEGVLTGVAPKPKVMNDIQFGWEIAKQMGGMDIGQSITVKDGTVLAVEAIEGTDACIERTGKLCPRGGWTLVKVSKPNQDMRFDVPTIGPQTVEKVRAAGGVAIAIEAKRTIVVDRQKTFEMARRAGLTIIAMHGPSAVRLSIASAA